MITAIFIEAQYIKTGFEVKRDLLSPSPFVERVGVRGSLMKAFHPPLYPLPSREGAKRDEIASSLMLLAMTTRPAAHCSHCERSAAISVLILRELPFPLSLCGEGWGEGGPCRC